MRLKEKIESYYLVVYIFLGYFQSAIFAAPANLNISHFNGRILLQRRQGGLPELPPIESPNVNNDNVTKSKLRITADSLKGRSTEVLSYNGRGLQLSYIGYSQPRSIAQWYKFGVDAQNSYSGFQPSVTSILNDANFGGVVRAFIIGIFFMILFPILMISMLCCRQCCNCCGGRKFNIDGYSQKAMNATFASFAFSMLMILTFGSIYSVYSSDFTFTLQAFEEGSKATYNDSLDFVTDTIDGLAYFPSTFATASDSAIYDVSRDNGDFASLFNASFYNSTYTVVDGLSSLGDDIIGIKTTVDNMTNNINEIKQDTDNIFTSLDNSLLVLNQSSHIEINGTKYQVQGFPEDIPSVSAPNISDIPDLSEISKSLSIGNTLKQYSENINSLYQQYILGNGEKTASLSDLVDIAALTGPWVESVKQQTSSIKGTSKYVEDSIQEVFKNYIYPYDSIRHTVFSLEVAIILVPLLLGVIGGAARRPLFMSGIPTMIIIMSIILWLQFSVFYIVSTPLNIVCNSRSAVMEYPYKSADIPSINLQGFTLSLNFSITVNPQVFIDSCRSGRNIFTADINKKNQSTVVLITDILNSNIDTFDSLIDSSISVENLFKQFDIDEVLNGINMSEISNIDFGNITAPQIDLGNTTETIDAANASLNQITPESLSGYGSETEMQAKLDEFNAAALNSNATWSNYTEQDVIDIYIIPEKDFSYEDVNASITDTSVQNNLEFKFQESYIYIQFRYSANNAINSYKAQVSPEIQNLNNIATVQVPELQKKIDDLFAALSGLPNQFQEVATNTETVKLAIRNLYDGLESFSPQLQYYLKIVARKTVQFLLRDFFANNPSPNFASCQPLAEDATYLLDSVCNNLTNALTGFWYDALLILIFFVFGFITTLMTKKRIIYLNNAHRIVAGSKQGSKGFDGPEVQEVVSLNSAPME